VMRSRTPRRFSFPPGCVSVRSMGWLRVLKDARPEAAWLALTILSPEGQKIMADRGFRPVTLPSNQPVVTQLLEMGRLELDPRAAIYWLASAPTTVANVRRSRLAVARLPARPMRGRADYRMSATRL
jgi:hypothetical protein